MSVVSSILSTRSTGWKIDVRLASLMDSIFAISFGLGLRFVIDTVSDHDFKVTGTLVGLWEGVIMLHFTKKMPKSSDPFIAYGVRLFVDFLYTESLTRLVLVLVWTALGMVLADVTPGIWYEVGLRRVWRRFRRDIYTMLQMIPTVAFFPPTRTVRFSPSREPSTIIEVDADADAVPPPSVITTEQTPTTNTVPTTTAPVARDILRRRVPGYFPADVSDTETELGSVRLRPSPGERTSRRLSVFPGTHDFDESVSSQNDLDEENLSSVSSASTERPGASSTVIDASTIPDMYAEEPLVDVAAAPVKDEEEMKTPKQSSAPYMPPTPSDSAMHLFRPRPSEEPLLVRPPSEFMPQIPDFLDEANTEDWEKIQRQEATEEKPPTPPAKDAAYKLKVPIIPAPVPPQPQLQRSTPSPEDESKGWDLLDSQFISNPNDTNNNATSNDYQVQTYDGDDDDDMYGDVAPEYSTLPAMGESSTTEPPPAHTTDFTSGIFGPDTVRTNPWAGVEEAERQREDAARKQQEDEDALKRKQEEDAAEAKRLEEEKLKEKEKKAQEKAERLKKEAEDAAIRKKKQEEAEAAERQRKEAVEQKRKEEEEAAEQQRKEDERKEEAEQKKREEAERKNREEVEKAAAKAKKLAEDAEAKRLKEEKKRLKEEADAIAAAAALAQARAEEAEQKKEEEAEAKRLEQEAAKAKKLAEDAEAKRLKEEEKRLKEEADALAAAAALAQALAEEAEWKKEEEAKRLEQEAATVKEGVRLIMEKERQIKEQEEADQRQEAEERGRTEAAQAEPISPSETRSPNNAEQDPEKDLPPQPLESQADGESTPSEASEAPSNEPSDRLHRMLLLRAQMVQVEGRLNDLTSPDSDQEIKQTEKILRKMRRQAERRYAAGVYFSCSSIIRLLTQVRDSSGPIYG
jgi:hypothetical protein